MSALSAAKCSSCCKFWNATKIFTWQILVLYNMFTLPIKKVYCYLFHVYFLRPSEFAKPAFYHKRIERVSLHFLYTGGQAKRPIKHEICQSMKYSANSAYLPNIAAFVWMNWQRHSFFIGISVTFWLGLQCITLLITLYKFAIRVKTVYWNKSQSKFRRGTAHLQYQTLNVTSLQYLVMTRVLTAPRDLPGLRITTL